MIILRVIGDDGNDCCVPDKAASDFECLGHLSKLTKSGSSKNQHLDPESLMAEATLARWAPYPPSPGTSRDFTEIEREQHQACTDFLDLILKILFIYF